MKNKVVLIIFLSLFTLFDLTAQSGVWQEVQDSIVAYPDDNIETVTKGGLLRIIDRNIDANGITYDSLVVFNQNTMGLPVDTVSPDTIYLNKQADYTFDISANDTVVLIDDLSKISYRGAYTNIIININVQSTDNSAVLYMSHNGVIIEYDSGVYDATKANIITIIRFGFKSGTNINQVATFDIRQMEKAVTPTVPIISSLEIGNVADNILVSVFDQSVNVTGITGMTLASDGDQITVTGVNSGSGTNTVQFNLSRSVLNTETITLSISATNDITSVIGGLSFAGVTDSAVVNNVSAFNYVDFTNGTNVTIDNVAHTVTYTGNGYAIGVQTLSKVAGSKVSIDIPSIDSGQPYGSVFIVLDANSAAFAYSGNEDHLIYQNNGNLNSFTSGVSETDLGAVSNNDVLTLELADDGVGDYNVLYKVNEVVYRTEPLNIAGTIYIHTKSVTAGKILTGARIE